MDWQLLRHKIEVSQLWRCYPAADFCENASWMKLQKLDVDKPRVAMVRNQGNGMDAWVHQYLLSLFLAFCCSEIKL